MKKLHGVAFVLVIIGALNWLLVGAFNWNLVTAIGGADSILTKIIYILVGISAVLLVATHKKSCKDCCNNTSSPTM